MGEHFKKQLTEEMSSMGIALSEEQVRQFETYYDLLIEWNNVMNLTAIGNHGGIGGHHQAFHRQRLPDKSCSFYIKCITENRRYRNRRRIPRNPAEDSESAAGDRADGFSQ